MGLETANYPNDLVETNPLVGDLKSQGDDHLRMIKLVLKNAFPGLGGRLGRVTAKSAGYTLVATDNLSVINCTAGLTLAVTTAPTLGNGFQCAIHASGGDVVIDPSTTETVNGALTATLLAGSTGLLMCDGANFWLLSTTIALAQLARTGTAGQVLMSNGASAAPSMQDIPVARPPGELADFAMNSVPSGWLACNGAAVNRVTYAGLFAAIGTTWGIGDGSTTFNVPDFRGHFRRGYGTHGDGTASGAFATKQADAYLSHTHANTLNDPGHSHSYTYGTSEGTGGSVYQSSAALGSLSVSSSTTGVSISNVASGGTETRPDNYAVLTCIKT